MKKLLFIDRDGTIIHEPEDEQIDSFEKLRFIPGAITGLHKIVSELDYDLILVTNQDGLGTESFPEENFWPAHNMMLQTLEGEGVVFKEILIDRTFPHQNADTRKPGIGMLKHYLTEQYDLRNSYVIGDRETDLQLADNMGCKAIYFSKQKKENVALSSSDWHEIYHFLKKGSRTAALKRVTKETSVSLSLNLDGTGQYKINTGLNFFNHMLEQFSKHSGIDMVLDVTGDLEIDEHHTIEDTALALGEAISKALGNKKRINRYGFVLPMDDVLATVAIDLSGRPWLVWETLFKREKVGDMPTEMFMHFFKSLSDTLKCNLHIKAEGENEHHKIEAIFKATAKALKMALSTDEDNPLLATTKGVL